MTSINTISRSVKYGLHFAASWPGTPLPIIHKLCWVIILGVLQTCQYSYVITHIKSATLIEIIDTVSNCMPFSLLSIKLVVAWTHHSLLRDILSTMEEECQKYAVIDTNNLILKTARLSYRLTNSILCACGSGAVFYAAGVFMPQKTNITMHRQFLLNMDLPFDANKSPIYELVVTLQCVYQATSAYTFGVFTALLLMIVLHVGCQIDIMCRTLMEVPYKSKRQLKFFISRYQEIITFTERIENLFTYIALSQLVTNTIIICCLGYLIVIALHVDSGFVILLKSIMFYIAISLQAFIYCFAGEYLSIKSKLISDTAYEFLWYNLDPNESRLLLVVILRSQRGFTFTFGKFANLSMESFAAIMKTSASYISVLLAMS